MQIAEIQAGATGAATEFPVVLYNATTGQHLTGATEAAVEIRYMREGQTSWTLLDDAAADNVFAEQGLGRYTQRTIAAAMASAAGVSYVDFLFSGAGILDQLVRVYLRAYDPKAAPATDASVATAVQTQLSDEFAAIPTASAIATAVDAAVADNFAAIPGAVVTALAAASDGRAFGVTSQPSGGSTVALQVRNAGGAVIGSRSAYYNAQGQLVGLTAVA